MIRFVDEVRDGDGHKGNPEGPAKFCLTLWSKIIIRTFCGWSFNRNIPRPWLTV